jgi:NAD(P)-dependent dehydrogenase (short-subunit alcohol dehydrogenase family)
MSEQTARQRAASTNLSKSAAYRPHEGKFAIITGGSRGIGAAVARNLAAKGCSLLLVYASDSSTGPTQALCEDLISTYGIRCVPVQADLSNPTRSAPYIVSSARNHFSHPVTGKFQIDFLINNAGIAGDILLNDPDKGPIEESLFDRVYKVNVLAPLLLTQACAPNLPNDRSGRIVNVSSVSSSIGYEGQSIYGGTKAALEAMTRTWSRELADRCTVNAVNPGPVWGDMYANTGPKFWKANQPFVDTAPLAKYVGNDEVKSMAGKDAEVFHKTVMESMGGRRPGFTEEIAGVIGMLCSEESGWTTGSVICANGGLKMSIA